MTRRELLLVLAALPAATLTASAALAQQSDDTFGQYGRRFLTVQERERFHLEMQNAATEEERERIRERHRDIIRERARQQGVTLPENFGGGAMSGQGMGQGSGQGMGQGSGQGGMGQGGMDQGGMGQGGMGQGGMGQGGMGQGN